MSLVASVLAKEREYLMSHYSTVVQNINKYTGISKCRSNTVPTKGPSPYQESHCIYKACTRSPLTPITACISLTETGPIKPDNAMAISLFNDSFPTALIIQRQNEGWS